MSHVPFLQRQRHAFRVKLVLGLCPFSLHDGSTAVRCSGAHSIFSAGYALLVVVAYPILSSRTLLSLNLGGISGTRNVAIVLEHITMYGVYSTVLGLSWHHRHRHARLLNSVAAICDRSAALGGTVRALNAQNLACLLVYNIGGLSTIALLLAAVSSVDLVTYIWLFQAGMCTVWAAMLHVRDLALLLADAHRASAATVAAANTSEQCDQALDRMADVRRAVAQLAQCFGWQLVLCTAKDVIILTTMSFYMVAEAVFWQNESVGTLLYFLFAYLLPIVVNMVLVVRAFERLQRQMATGVPVSPAGWSDVS